MIDGLINMEIDPIGERVAIGSPPVIFASWNKETTTLVSIHSPPADAQVDPDNLRIVRENISKLETQDAHLQELKANFIKSLGFPIEDSKISSTSVRPAIVAGSPALLTTIVADSYAQPRSKTNRK